MAWCPRTDVFKAPLPSRWFGKCWHIQDLLKYEFDVEFEASWSVHAEVLINESLSL